MARNLKLKPNTYLSLEDVKEHLKIKDAVTDADNTLIRIINMACAQVENYIQGPVITREYVELKDGNHANVIIPDYFPVVELVEIRIDYNGGFGDSTVVDPQNTILRGQPNMKGFQSSDIGLKIEGTDILLRDAADTSLLGRLFTGSSASSIKITYKAGRGETPDDLPDDLVYATLMLVEYYYIVRENRELNIKSKTNKDQGYDRETGIPKEITYILDNYKDYSFGHANLPQKNNFPV